MSAMELVLIIMGVVIFLLGYLLPGSKKKPDEEVQMIGEDEVRKMIAGEIESARDKISDIVDETINYSIEKTERALERVTNEKIMAVNEYSDTVLEEINKYHKEVVFLYDMLNDKHDNLRRLLLLMVLSRRQRMRKLQRMRQLRRSRMLRMQRMQQLIWQMLL